MPSSCFGPSSAASSCPASGRAGQVIDARLDTRLQKGDALALAGRRTFVMAGPEEIGPEADDTELLDFPVDTVDVVITNAAYDGKTLGELASARHWTEESGCAGSRGMASSCRGRFGPRWPAGMLSRWSATSPTSSASPGAWATPTA